MKGKQQWLVWCDADATLKSGHATGTATHNSVTSSTLARKPLSQEAVVVATWRHSVGGLPTSPSMMPSFICMHNDCRNVERSIICCVYLNSVWWQFALNKIPHNNLTYRWLYRNFKLGGNTTSTQTRRANLIIFIHHKMLPIVQIQRKQRNRDRLTKFTILNNF